MSLARTMLCRIYYAIAALALIGTWRQNIAFMQEAGVALVDGFVAFWPALLVNRATTSITIDIFVLMFAAVVWMVLEARRLQIRHVWLYLFFGMTIAISVTFPLFLAARERRLAELSQRDTEPSATLSDQVGLGLFGAATIAFTLWCTLR